jgi:hypothetical protein
MAYSYTINKQDRAVRVTVTGHDTVLLNKARIQAITSDPDWEPGYNVLVDFRSTHTFDLSMPDIEELAALHESLESIIGDGKLAVVASTDVVYGISRMWETVTESHTLLTTNVFRDLREAEDWLGIPHNDTERQ